MIVDDEPDLREILEERFQVFNFETLTAGSGNQAWALLQKEKFDVVLSDIQMPDGTGLELLKKIKDANTVAPAVFLMTGFHQDFSDREMFDQGADGFLSKPFDASQIRNSIQKAIIPPRARWSTTGRYSTDKTLAVSVQSIGQDIKVGRHGFSVVAPKHNITLGQILAFQTEGALKLTGMGKLAWEHQLPGGRKTIGVELLSLDPTSLDTYLALLESNPPRASIPLIS